MKLYLLGDDTLLLRWKTLLDILSPSVISSLEQIAADVQSIAIVSDTVMYQNLDFMNPNIRVLVLSTVPNFEQAQYFLRQGAMGYGNAMMHEAHLHSAFQTLEEGNVWLYPDFISRLIIDVRDQTEKKEKALHCLDPLSAREKEVAHLLSDGKSHHDIAEALGITIRTVKAHSAAIYEKLNVTDRLALSLLLHT